MGTYRLTNCDKFWKTDLPSMYTQVKQLGSLTLHLVALSQKSIKCISAIIMIFLTDLLHELLVIILCVSFV